MKPRIEESKGYMLVGIGIDCTEQDKSDIGPLWKEMGARSGEIKHSGIAFGACMDYDHHRFHYIAAWEVDSVVEAPQGMKVHQIPPCKYAVYPFHGKVSDMPAEFDRIYTKYLPEAGLKLKEGSAVLERYPQDCWDEKTGSIKADLMLPITD